MRETSSVEVISFLSHTEKHLTRCRVVYYADISGGIHEMCSTKFISKHFILLLVAVLAVHAEMIVLFYINFWQFHRFTDRSSGGAQMWRVGGPNTRTVARGIIPGQDREYCRSSGNYALSNCPVVRATYPSSILISKNFILYWPRFWQCTDV